MSARVVPRSCSRRPTERPATASLGITGTLTLDAQGDPDAIFIFQLGADLVAVQADRVGLVVQAGPANMDCRGVVEEVLFHGVSV